jgi:sodium/hydrogen antiporter
VACCCALPVGAARVRKSSRVHPCWHSHCSLTLCATLIGVNGFVAAFAAGSAFGAFAGRGEEREVYYVEQTCGLASMICWLLFGAIGVPTIADSWSWRILLYALLSLTMIRMLPVAISLLRARMDWATMFFIGWFGPRGLASVVFALLALEDLHGAPALSTRWSPRLA